MKKGQTHIIKNQRYEIDLKKASEAQKYQSKVSLLQKYEIENVLQRVMDSYSDIDFLDQFEEVTLDIGTLSPYNFEKELPLRIEESLQNFFKNNSKGNTLKKGKRIRLFNRNLQQFEFFLRYGHLPWDTAHNLGPTDIFNTLFQESPEELVKILKRYGTKEHIRKRMIAQMNTTFLEGIVVAVVRDEGEYINTCRNHIEIQQKKYKWVHTNSGNFKEVLWEIVLAYIFTEVTNFSNRKNFLHYVILNIARRFGFGYAALLQLMCRGISRKNGPQRSAIDFERILFSLREDENKKNSTLRHQMSETTFKANMLGAAELLLYYLKYGAIPTGQSVTSKHQLYNLLENLEKKGPKALVSVFNVLRNDTSSTYRLKREFPDTFLNTLMDTYEPKTISNFLSFLEQGAGSMEYSKKKSRMLNTIQKQRGRLMMEVCFRKDNMTNDQEIEAFLSQVQRKLGIDPEFVQLLAHTEGLGGVPGRNAMKSFVDGFQNRKTPISEAQVNDFAFLGFSKSLYPFYKANGSESITEFHEQLCQRGYSKMVLQWTSYLLDIIKKNVGYTQEDIVKWLGKHGDELAKKGEKPIDILGEMLFVLDLLTVDEKLYNGIASVLLSKGEPSTFRERQQIPIVPPYQFLVNRLSAQLYQYSMVNSSTKARQLILAFADKYNLSVAKTVKELGQYIDNSREHLLLQEIFEEIVLEESRKNQVKIPDIVYKRDLVAFFCAQGVLPWWAESNSMKILAIYFSEILNGYPEHLIPWFSKSSFKRKIIGILDDKDYELLCHYAAPVVGQLFLKVQEIWIEVFREDLSGFGRGSTQDAIEIRYLSLKSAIAHFNKPLKTIFIQIVQELSTYATCKAYDMGQMFRDKLKKSAIGTQGKKKLEACFPADVMSLKMSSMQERQWTHFMEVITEIGRKTTAFSEKEIVLVLKQTHKTNPQNLLSQLKQQPFRDQFITSLHKKTHLTVLKLFLNTRENERFVRIVSVLEEINKKLTMSQKTHVWHVFADRIFFAIGLGKHKSWALNEWVSLLVYTMKEVLKEKEGQAIIHGILVKNPKEMVIVEHIKRLMGGEEKNRDIEVIEEKKKVMEEEILGESIYIHNAGMVLLGPYIPMLFERLGLLENKQFKDESCLQKGMESLQYAVGGNTSTEEHQLVLNKIICGKSIYEPIQQIKGLKEDEMQIIDGMLDAVISNWPAIGNTTIEGLRETFLNRDGRIVLEEDKYVLHVEQKAFDMLLDQIPWNISVLKLSWMKKLLEIVWR
ncbi:contractile injection system tape measure protein [Spongiimicrobium salis]|uniref:contractile injection system tape measure protein n=1 Tax=Spongiimicrobium salis TaxID=1667022 RepID=UPI00374CE59C